MVYRSSPRTTIDIPGTVYRLHASPSAVARNLPPPIVLPDASSGSIDWDSLVSVASRALDGKNLSVHFHMARGSCKNQTFSF